MYVLLTLGVLLAVIVIYLPGYIISRGLAFDHFASVACAPLFSLPLITLVGMVLFEVYKPISGGVYFAIVLGLSLLIWAIGKGIHAIFERRGTQETLTKPLLSFPLSAEIWQTALLYIAVALIICLFVFISALPSPDAFSRNDDTTVHLSLVRGFLDSGTYSTLHASSFLDWSVSDSHYYPSTWHCIAAIVASVLGNQVTIATNATIIATVVFVLPLGLLFLLTMLFPRNHTILRSGALFSVAFAAFPWGYIVYGQLLPNLLSFSLVAPTLAILIGATNEKQSRQARLILGVLVGIAALVLTQANGVFTWGILATAYLISRMFYIPGHEYAVWSWRRGLGAAVILLGACALWTALYCAPFLQNIVHYENAQAVLSVPEAVLAGLSFFFMSRGAIQPMLSIFVLIGVIWTCKNRRYLWLTIAFAFSFCLYVLTVSSDPAPIRQFLGGFWYADYRRIGAMTALFAIPIATCGFSWIIAGLRSLALKVSASASKQKVFVSAGCGLLILLLILSQIIPFKKDMGADRTIAFGLAHSRSKVAELHSWDSVLTDEERAFIQQVQSIIPAHALVINMPHDGSAWAYGTDGINILFRRPANNGSNYVDPEDNTLIRTKLAEVSTNAEIANLLRELDAHYLLLLDASDSPDPTKTDRRYDEDKWIGIESIDENTPGFSLLLSEGDMRLYEITG